MSRFTYSNGRYYQDGRPFFVIASDYQFYRDRRDHWEDRLTKLKEGGINLITFYTPWRHHLQWDGSRRWPRGVVPDLSAVRGPDNDQA